MTALSDAELLSGARNGDEAAYTELYVRHHAAARRLAQGYKRHGDPDDLVNGAFERVLAALRRGSGPTESFRAYLFVTLRRLAMEQSRADESSLDEVPEPVVAVAGDRELDMAERRIIAEAFESLPGPWQTVLWQTAVEGKQPKEFAGAVGMTPNAVAALAYRARERLKQAYLQAHLQLPARNGCEPYRSRLGGYVRGGLSSRHDTATRQHLDGCASCRQLVDELSDVNRMLVKSVAPIFVLAGGGKAVSSLVAPAAAGATTATTHGTGLLTGAVDVGRRVGAAAGGVIAAAVTAVALAVTILPHDGGPADRGRAVDVEAGAPGGATQDARAASSSSDPTATTVTTAPTTTAAPAPAAGTATTAAEATTTTTADEALVDAEVGGVDVGADVDVGPGGVEAQAHLGLDLSWTEGLLGSGSLVARVLNDGQALAEDVSIDVQLQGGAQLTGVATGCALSADDLITGVISLLRSLTCPVTQVLAGQEATASFPLLAGADAAVEVTLRVGDRVVQTQVLDLAVG